MTTYTTHGSVRGGCGHRHRTQEAAERCLASDQRDCSRAGARAYSDRQVVVVGDDGLLYYDEAQEAFVPGPGGRTSGAARFS